LEDCLGSLLLDWPPLITLKALELRARDRNIEKRYRHESRQRLNMKRYVSVFASVYHVISKASVQGHGDQPCPRSLERGGSREKPLGFIH
jgi:hypothetical protein